MRIRPFAAAALLGVSVLGLSGCTTGVPTQVSRYQSMPSAQGQSFFITAANPAAGSGLEFSRYAGQVAQALQAQGYAQAPSLDAATMVVSLDYGVDEGHQRVERDPFARGYGYDPFYGGYNPWGYYSRPYYSRFGYYGPRSPFYYGWNDPYWYGGFDGPFQEVRAYTEYRSFLDLVIRRRVDSAPLFEGHAQARSANDDLGVLVPNLIEAMFTRFPGRSGETIKITVPPPRKG
jgi:hypothetical protein